MGCGLIDGCPESGAVIGVREMAEFVDADVVLYELGGGDEPPVETYACAGAAYAPVGLGVGKRDGGRGEFELLAVSVQFG